jgi:hypothetical protein
MEGESVRRTATAPPLGDVQHRKAPCGRRRGRVRGSRRCQEGGGRGVEAGYDSPYKRTHAPNMLYRRILQTDKRRCTQNALTVLDGDVRGGRRGGGTMSTSTNADARRGWARRRTCCGLEVGEGRRKKGRGGKGKGEEGGGGCGRKRKSRIKKEKIEANERNKKENVKNNKEVYNATYTHMLLYHRHVSPSPAPPPPWMHGAPTDRPTDETPSAP